MPASGADAGGLTDTATAEHLLAQLGLREASARDGDYAMEMPVTPLVVNTRGGLQGGLLATLVDIAAGIASLQGLPPGQSAATSDMTLHFLSAVTVGPARAEATVRRRGKRVIVTQVEVWDVGRDVLAAIATATFHVVELREGQVDGRGVGDAGRS